MPETERFTFVPMTAVLPLGDRQTLQNLGYLLLKTKQYTAAEAEWTIVVAAKDSYCIVLELIYRSPNASEDVKSPRWRSDAELKFRSVVP